VHVRVVNNLREDAWARNQAISFWELRDDDGLCFLDCWFANVQSSNQDGAVVNILSEGHTAFNRCGFYW
jgi:hypothetical protein